MSRLDRTPAQGLINWRFALKRRSISASPGLWWPWWLSRAPCSRPTSRNGGFEGALNDGGAGYQTLPAGSNELAPWTITGGEVDWISHYWTAAEGANSIDLNGFEPGAISQTIPTTAGNTYVVAFQLAGNPGTGPRPPRLSPSRPPGTTATGYYVRHDRQVAQTTWAGRPRATRSWRRAPARPSPSPARRARPLRPRARQRRRDRTVARHDRRRLQGRRLEDHDQQRRRHVQEPGCLRQLLREGRDRSRSQTKPQLCGHSRSSPPRPSTCHNRRGPFHVRHDPVR